MRKHAIVLGLAFLGLAAFAMLAGWAFFAGWSRLGPAWALAGALVVAAMLAGLLMWLAAYAASQGYDDPN